MEQLLSTKLNIPPTRPQLVFRPRLMTKLNEGLNRKLTLISAPAGYGKTTLVVEWLRQQDQPFAWLTLDRGDNDPVRFLVYLVASWQKVYPNIGHTAQAILEAPQAAATEQVLTSLINEIAEKPLFFVLDDYHVIENSAIHEALKYLLDHMPLQLHLVITTRADPPLPIPRLRGRGQLCELHAVDLRFALDEVEAFLSKVMGLVLSNEQIIALERHTEGWITGLQMAALSMQGRENVSEFIQAFTGSHHYILDYLTEEVVNQQTKEIEAFLLHTSILDRLSGPLCNKVTGQENSHSTLKTLEAANFFLVPLDEERRWYRYHPLFADLLRQRLQIESSSLAPELHRRASEWFKENGFIPEAVSHSLAAGDYERAASLIEKIAWPILAPREMGTLQGWLEALPCEIVQGRPRLVVSRTWALAVSGQWDAVEPSLADVDIQSVQGEAAAIRAYVALRQGDVVRSIKLAHQALKQLPTENIFLRATVAQDLGVAYSSKGEPEAAGRALNEAIMLSRTAGLTYSTLAATSTLGHVQDTQGLLHKAVETQRKALELAHVPGGQPIPIAGMAYVGIAEVLYEWNDLDGALHYAMQGIKLLKLGGFISYQIIGFSVLTRVYLSWGELDKAMELIQGAEQLVKKHQYTFVEPILTYLRIRFYIAQGDVGAAYRWVRAQGLNLDDKLENAPEAKQSIGAWLLIVMASSQATGEVSKLDEVQNLLSRLLETEKAAGRMWNFIKFLTFQALAFQAQSEVGKALFVLQQALSLAESEGYIRTFVDEGEMMERLLLQAQSRDIAPNYVETLLAALRETKEISQTKASPLIDPLSEREMEVLHLIAAGLSNHQIAEELVIAVSTVKSHINHIYGKLDVKSRTQAVARGQALGLL